MILKIVHMNMIKKKKSLLKIYKAKQCRIINKLFAWIIIAIIYNYFNHILSRMEENKEEVFKNQIIYKIIMLNRKIIYK